MSKKTANVLCKKYQHLSGVAGPLCKNKHVRRVACQNYLYGFCLDGPNCKFVQYGKFPILLYFFKLLYNVACCVFLVQSLISHNPTQLLLPRRMQWCAIRVKNRDTRLRTARNSPGQKPLEMLRKTSISVTDYMYFCNCVLQTFLLAF